MKILLHNKYFILLILLFVVACIYAQDVPPPKPNDGRGPGLLPIDGGLILLSTIALAYGVIKKK